MIMKGFFQIMGFAAFSFISVIGVIYSSLSIIEENKLTPASIKQLQAPVVFITENSQHKN
jgi:hypothetical protein